jgi:CubicO group peptidase (beta-lactamase class C family)
MPLAHAIAAIVEGAISREIFPGAVVLIARNDTIQHAAAYGSTMYSAPGSQPVGLDTIYDIASLTKVFTSTAALRLIEQGQLDLNAPVASYLPELRAPGVTVRHVLTHTSGLDIRLSTLRHAGRAGMLDAVYQARLLHPPGATVAYTNVNSLLLGEIVARLCGRPLDEAIRALVIEPLGLTDTGFRPTAGLLPRIAPTEIDVDWRGGLVHGSVHDESAHVLGGVAGHAGLFSTAADLYAFCRVWLDDGQRDDQALERRVPGAAPSLLRPETIALARTNQTSGLNLACGLGWMIDRPNFMGQAPAGTIGHTGFTGPAITISPAQQLIVIVLSNRIYPRRQPPEHHTSTAAIVNAALRANEKTCTDTI